MASEHTDTLSFHFPTDPGARAAYSSNPWFTEGADAPHPIRAVADSLLAQPEIAEALELVYLNSALSVAAEESEPSAESRIDAGLALDGLNLMMEYLDQDSALRREITAQYTGLADNFLPKDA